MKCSTMTKSIFFYSVQVLGVKKNGGLIKQGELFKTKYEWQLEGKGFK